VGASAEVFADNLSIGAGTDGSSKASGTRYNHVRDGDLNTDWSPTGSTGRISIKWRSATTVGSAVIKEAAGSEGHIGSGKLVDHNKGTVLASGSGAGTMTFDPVSLKSWTSRLRDHPVRLPWQSSKPMAIRSRCQVLHPRQCLARRQGECGPALQRLGTRYGNV
jgi:hypothetical protein